MMHTAASSASGAAGETGKARLLESIASAIDHVPKHDAQPKATEDRRPAREIHRSRDNIAQRAARWGSSSSIGNLRDG